ncbi:HIRA-interacting protein 3 isoform X2 [Cyclopterus lumpus]|uniref:HIRA-interacting protein 3 isoform X2 n=1 Tax=Cyclopterus lumpus TaxID=8103 RepID=UPI00148694C3|nr:HIRA-interacting protein 3 isoform X2 [Cyclopterus lumpus]
MMVSEEEATAIRKFVCGQLRGEPNLSDENGSELETSKRPQNKRKREKERDEVISGDDDESTAKKSRRQLNSSSESVEKDNCKTGSESEEEGNNSEYEDAEQEVKQSLRKTNAKGKQQISSKDSTDEEINKSEENKEKEKSLCEDNPKVMKKANATKNGGKRSSNTSQGEKTPQSNEENETDTDGKSEKSEKINGNDSSDDSENEEKVKNNDLDSDSSSLPSLEDEQHGRKEKTQDDKKKKATKKEEEKEKTAKSQKDDDKAVVRLKRYISLCGVRLNYKKLLDGCRSVRSQVAALKKELEGLGVHGQPSIMKCKKVRMKREESQELAELDVSNIIATEGRPKRRATSAWQEQHNAPTSTYLRSLNSGSDSDEESNTHRGRRRATDWTNLQGVISDDAESN